MDKKFGHKADPAAAAAETGQPVQPGSGADGQQKTASAGKRHPVRRVLLILAGVWAAVILVLQIILTPEVLKRIANAFADEYVDGTVTFSNIEASVFRNFPNLNVSIEDFSITCPSAESDSLGDAFRDANPILHLGCGEQADTLVSFRKFSGGVNLISALSGKIRIRRAELEGPRIFAKQYGADGNNWDIFRITLEDDGDSSAFRLPSVSVGRISLTGKPVLAYSNPKDTVYGGIFLKQIDVAGHYNARKGRLSGLSLDVDSLLVAGRLPSDTLAFALNHFGIEGMDEGYRLSLESKLHLLLKSAGRMSVPLEASADFFPSHEEKRLSVRDLKATLATLDFSGEGDLSWSENGGSVRAKLSIDEEPVKETVDFFKKNFPILKKLKTGAKISAEALCEGKVRDGVFPPVTVRITVPESGLEWKGVKGKGSIALDAGAVFEDGMLDAGVSRLKIGIEGLLLDLSAQAEDILGEDPLLKVDSRISAALQTVAGFFPDSLKISGEGKLSGNLEGEARLSELSTGNFSASGLKGKIAGDGIRVSSGRDTISVFLGKASVTVGASADPHCPGKTGITASVDSLSASYGVSTYFRGSGIRLSAHNPEEKTGGSDAGHPLNISLDISALGMMDLDSCFVGLAGSSSSILLSSEVRNGVEIPHFSLSSSNSGIAVRRDVNRFSFRNIGLEASGQATKNQAKVRWQHLTDSLRKAHPELPPDSLFRRSRGNFQGRQLPDFLSEKDFFKKDIDIRLSGSLAEYVRNWEAGGSLKISEVRVISPYFPLENRVSDVACSFDNDRITLKTAKLSSGSSDLSAEGSLSGLRMSLTSRGRLALKLGISSDFIDAGEIVQALNEGKSFVPPGGNAAVSDLDDEGYLRSVTENKAVDSTALDALVVIPSNLNASVTLNAKSIKYLNLETSKATSSIEMRERCLQLTNTAAKTNMGEITLEGFYSTKTKKDLKAGFDLKFADITAEKVIELFPVVDSLLPMFSSIRGLLDCEIAATTSVDTTMQLVLPTLSGIVKIDGKNLALADGEEMRKLKKSLKFKDRDSCGVDNLSVRGIVRDNRLEIFPFVLNVDRYRLAASGVQQFDQNFLFHISAIKSPVPFRFGVNLKGTIDDWKWRLSKAKYKSGDVPVFDEQVEDLRLKLTASIRSIFERGADGALRQNEEAHRAIEKKKSELSYSVEAQTDSLSASELEALAKLEGED